MDAGVLVCPQSRVLLERGPAPVDFLSPIATGFRPRGRTDEMLVRVDGAGAYPVVDGVPVLLAPEMLTPPPDRRTVDVTVAPYASAYEEMDHYSDRAAAEARSVATSKAARRLERIMAVPAQDRTTFPHPVEVWLDATYDLAAQADAYTHLLPLAGARVLQLGGRGAQAVTFLLAGAAEAWVSTPMVGELLYAEALARHCGVADRLRTVAAVAEQLPFAANQFDVIYSQGCVHHWVVDLALPECARVLTPGGRFAAVEPWRGPLYGMGTRVLGKRDRGVRCQVLTPSRIHGPLSVFGENRIEHHGALSRYPLIALWKAGIKPGQDRIWRIFQADDAVTARFPKLRQTGSSVALLATVGGSS